MNDNDTPSELDKLDERLRTAREDSCLNENGSIQSLKSGGFEFVFRIGVELVAALAVGVGIGLLFDWWLGTTPWCLVVFFFVGSGAGIVNVYRATERYGLATGYEMEKGKDSGTEELNKLKTRFIKPLNNDTNRKND